MTPPQARDPEATRAAILDAAEAEFLANGFSGAALSAIARKADVAKSLIHHHFGSKKELWQEVKVRRFSTYADRQMEILQRTDSSPDLLRESIITYFRFLRDNPEMVRMLAWMYLEHDDVCDETATKDGELMQLGANKIRTAQREGFIRSDLNPYFVLITFIGLCQQWFHDRDHFGGVLGLDTDDPALDDTYLDTILRIFFEGIAPRG